MHVHWFIGDLILEAEGFSRGSGGGGEHCRNGGAGHGGCCGGGHGGGRAGGRGRRQPEVAPIVVEANPDIVVAPLQFLWALAGVQGCLDVLVVALQHRGEVVAINKDLGLEALIKEEHVALDIEEVLPVVSCACPTAVEAAGRQEHPDVAVAPLQHGAHKLSSAVRCLRLGRSELRAAHPGDPARGAAEHRQSVSQDFKNLLTRVLFARPPSVERPFRWDPDVTICPVDLAVLELASIMLLPALQSGREFAVPLCEKAELNVIHKVQRVPHNDENVQARTALLHPTAVKFPADVGLHNESLLGASCGAACQHLHATDAEEKSGADSLKEDGVACADGIRERPANLRDLEGLAGPAIPERHGAGVRGIDAFGGVAAQEDGVP
mmetsp:Transcript_34995/g.96766  ORF Transcript_34995/g.96766 Transcript_34995/m.96766 type:complete len:381 (+) Transcript_34995:1075-2217(+)